MKPSSKRAGKAIAPARSQGQDPVFGDGPGAPDEVLSALLLELTPVEPASKRRAALQARILERAAQPAAPAPAVAKPARRAPAIITIPASDEGWFEALPKIRIKQVYTDGTAESYLVRLEPGARAPAHDHPGDEECIVLEGSVRYIGGSTLHAGDYEAVLEGAHHSELVSDTGALVFLRYSQPLSGYLKL